MVDHREEAPAVKRKRRPRTPVGIPFSTVERLIAKLHGLPEDEPTALRARLHNLRKLNFPDGVAAGSGRHFAYAAPDVIGLVVAFDIMESFVPPGVAVAMVRAGWPEIARAALGAGRSTSPTATVTIHPRALKQMAASESGVPTHHVELEAIAGSPDPNRTITVDVGALSGRTLKSLQSIDPRSHALMLSGLESLERLFGNGPAIERPDANPQRFGTDGPFWQRAGSLLASIAAGLHPDDTRILTWFVDYAVRPAPVERWKTRVEVDQGAADVGFGAALAWLCATAGLQPSRTALPADELQRVGHQLIAALGSREGLAERLAAIVGKATESR